MVVCLLPQLSRGCLGAVRVYSSPEETPICGYMFSESEVSPHALDTHKRQRVEYGASPLGHCPQLSHFVFR